MGFSWNGTHTNSLNILAEAVTIPILPQIKLFTEELPGRNGFLDFTRFNNDNAPHFEPREWVYRLAFEESVRDTAILRANAISALFGNYYGVFIADEMPDAEWDAIIINKIDLTVVARTLYTFGVNIKTQAFPRE